MQVRLAWPLLGLPCAEGAVLPVALAVIGTRGGGERCRRAGGSERLRRRLRSSARVLSRIAPMALRLRWRSRRGGNR